MTRPLLFSFAVLVTVALARGGDDGVKAELKQLQGTWKVVQAIDNGEKVPADDLASMVIIIEGEKLSVREKDKVQHRMTLKIDPSKKPKTIDLTHTEGAKKDKTDMGIFKLEGDMLTICVNEKAGGDRPTEFTSKTGSGHGLVVLKRAK
jgi:uncharacterized protein (TIGR03067 family)